MNCRRGRPSRRSTGRSGCGSRSSRSSSAARARPRTRFSGCSAVTVAVRPATPKRVVGLMCALVVLFAVVVAAFVAITVAFAFVGAIIEFVFVDIAPRARGPCPRVRERILAARPAAVRVPPRPRPPRAHFVRTLRLAGSRSLRSRERGYGHPKAEGYQATPPARAERNSGKTLAGFNSSEPGRGAATSTQTLSPGSLAPQPFRIRSRSRPRPGPRSSQRASCCERET